MTEHKYSVKVPTTKDWRDMVKCQAACPVLTDSRGFFFREFCKKELFNSGIIMNEIVQINQSFNKIKGTFRGLHYQVPPYAEEKIVTCINGSVADLIVDLRKSSPQFLTYEIVELSAENKIRKLKNQLRDMTARYEGSCMIRDILKTERDEARRYARLYYKESKLNKNYSDWLFKIVLRVVLKDIDAVIDSSTVAT